MKKILSVICMALLAGGMIFTSCTKNWTVTVKANNDAWGTVTGGGTYADQATATIAATPADGYEFVKWDDGVKDNPRTVTVTANVTYTAIFEAAKPSVKVTFNNAVWDAKAFNARYFESQGAWDVFAGKENLQEFPIADCAAFADAIGTYSDATTDGRQWQNQVVAFIEYYDDSALQDQDGNTYGDWWAKSVNIEVTGFDILNMVMSANVGATMFDAEGAFVDGEGFAAAATAPMTVNAHNVEMAAAKGSLKKISTNVSVK